MTQDASIAAPEKWLRPTVAVALSLAGAAAGLTLLYLGMRSVMDIGGACADGGPFVPRQSCPDGVPLLMLAGIWGGIIACGIYVWQTIKYRIPSLIALAWPALFLSLGWNFFEYAFNPPFGSGIVWGWLVCGVVFVLMGGLPLLVVVRPTINSFRGAPSSWRASTKLVTKMVEPVAAVVRASGGPNTGETVAARASSVPNTGEARSQATSNGDLVSTLERLAALHRTGALSDIEFEAAKQSLLKGDR